MYRPYERARGGLEGCPTLACPVLHPHVPVVLHLRVRASGTVPTPRHFSCLSRPRVSPLDLVPASICSHPSRNPRSWHRPSPHPSSRPSTSPPASSHHGEPHCFLPLPARPYRENAVKGVRMPIRRYTSVPAHACPPRASHSPPRLRAPRPRSVAPMVPRQLALGLAACTLTGMLTVSAPKEVFAS